MSLILFARVGWMTYYNGPNQVGDDRPQGGGSYTEKNIGNEAFNFKDVGGHLYGYFQPQVPASSIALERIQPGCSAPSVAGVTVVFISTHPEEGGQRIAGWYKNATVFRHPQEDEGSERMGFQYFLKTKVSDAALLPTENRLQLKLSGKGGFGTANIRYLYDGDKPLVLPWAKESLEFINSYDGGNLLENHVLESSKAIQGLVEATISNAAGFESNPRIRKAVEYRAMKIAIEHFEKKWSVTDVHKNHSYDLHCKSGVNELFVEVKGTRGRGESVFLTRNEVKLARKQSAKCVLAVVDSIKVSGTKKRPRATGGTLRLIPNWNPDKHELEEVGYVCTLKFAKAAKAAVL
jgi:hypothetical protein